MVKIAPTLAVVLPLAAAWPAVMNQVGSTETLLKRAKRDGRLNTGAGHPDPPFDAASQYVDTTDNGPRPFKAPGSTDLRGQCPGLNAAANHGFLPRNGLVTIQDTIDGLGAAYNMSPELAAGLAAIAILLSGDIPSTTWSIGGEFPSTLPLILSEPQGIVGTHNKYEGDSSIVRGDAYLNNGNIGVFQAHSWNNIRTLIAQTGDFNFGQSIQQSNFVTQYSIQNNPHYFSGPFSGLVAPAAHNFVVTFMSNHSVEHKGGILEPNVINSFFAVTNNDDGTWTHNRGMERIPTNWYRRPGGINQYNVADVFLDLLAGAAEYPDTLHIGGNTGTVNSFIGVEPADLTGGVYTGANLFEGNNLACFAFQAAMAGGIDELKGLESILGSLLDPVLAPLKAIYADLQCPQLANYDDSELQKFPGFGDPAST
ncbi:Hypothetical protein R9X50_00515000 [Acrodontium crateriforme]|uniref:Heme haloperoxidase family profile domain-containing protein n=1 Tax=Acrodontium crateriforme TaxID=150365 RepID=A0AAQ3M8U3_9PEZI|nr:Hypothetical protein R9X50_00515000 [Acrodontium crateriforme]